VSGQISVVVVDLNSLATEIDVLVEAVRARWGVLGIALAVVHRSGPVHINAYGVRSVATSEPADRVCNY